jgi:hypothetical protein
MSWFTESAAEPEPLTDQDRLVNAEQECAFAESAWNLAAANLRAFNVENQQAPFVFTNGDTSYIQTFCDNAVRKKLGADVRSALSRRNAAWAHRAELLMKTRRFR